MADVGVVELDRRPLFELGFLDLEVFVFEDLVEIRVVLIEPQCFGTK